MRFLLAYTGLRVRHLDAAIEFFTNVLGMHLEARVPAPWRKGEFANLLSPGGKHKLELSWYADDSPVAGPFRQGDELDHLGFEVDDFDEALARLEGAGYKPAIGPIVAGAWHIAHVPVIEKIWLDVYHTEQPKRTHRKPRGPTKKGKRRR